MHGTSMGGLRSGSTRLAAAAAVSVAVFCFAQLAAAAPSSGSKSQRTTGASAVGAHSSFLKVLRAAHRNRTRKRKRPVRSSMPAPPQIPAPAPTSPPSATDFQNRVGFSTPGTLFTGWRGATPAGRLCRPDGR